MTDSHPDRRRRLAFTTAVLVAMLSLAGCRTPGAIPRGSALQRDIEHAIIIPDVADQTAAEVAAAALISNREEAQLALERMESIDIVLAASDERPTGLSSVAHDLVNATQKDARQYRQATRRLLEEDELDPALRGRLDLVANDDPLVLARRRMMDSYQIKFGRAFNAVAEPIGKSISNINMAPYRLARALVTYAASVYSADKLPLQERQALAHWKDYLEHYPNAEDAPELQQRVKKFESEWLETQRNRYVRASKRALGRGQPRLALVYATRALSYVPEDRKAEELRSIAATQLERQRANRLRSVSTDPESNVAPPEGVPLARALLLPDGDVEAEANALLADDPTGPLADEATFALATVHGEAGREDVMWDLYGELAKGGAEDDNMGRHAGALYGNPEENAYRAFVRTKRRNVLDNSLWVLFGPYYRGVPERNLPKYVNWALGAGQAVESVMGSPMRLIQMPWMKSLPAASQTALYGHRYLERFPNGEHATDVSEWIEAFEKKRGNHVGAYRIAENRSNATIKELDKYRKEASEQALASAFRAERRDVRLSTLRAVNQEFADTEAGHEAGKAIRQEIVNASPHRVRISRGFLLENPRVAGPVGIGIRPELLDDDASNGELHPDGMALLGGNNVEFYYVGTSGNDKKPPAMKRETISKERLARIVSALEEEYYENSLLDADDPIQADSRREAFFERARLGLPTADRDRPSASADFAYKGLRERYGMVRSRKSILPFDIVIKGSLTDLSLGAYPRIREPRRTPDAFLYK
jgi:hypothetical protein